MRVSLALCVLLLPLSTYGADSSDTEEPPPETLAAAAADDAALEAAVAAGGDAGAAVLRLAAARHASALARISHSPRVQEPTLALLRSAARLVPASAAYWNDLGVFELRRGMHKKAQQRFQRALRADPPGHAEARANLARLHAVYWDDGALPKTLLHDHDRVEIEHGLTNLTRVHVDDLAKPSFQHYRLGAVPYILTGAVTRERGYDAAWWSLRRQGELFPKSPTDFYPQVQASHLLVLTY
jgi:tetratricopeptide (TPR) repeat protein